MRRQGGGQDVGVQMGSPRGRRRTRGSAWRSLGRGLPGRRRASTFLHSSFRPAGCRPSTLRGRSDVVVLNNNARSVHFCEGRGRAGFTRRFIHHCLPGAAPSLSVAGCYSTETNYNECTHRNRIVFRVPTNNDNQSKFGCDKWKDTGDPSLEGVTISFGIDV